MINLTLIIPTTVRDAVKALRDAGESPANLSKVLQLTNAGSLNREFTRGAKTFTTVYAVVEEDNLAEVLTGYPDAEVIEARVYETGLHYGQLPDLVEDGEIKTIKGNRIYPAHADHLDICPDIITRDEDGIETSRERPTQVTPQLSVAGAADRIG